MSEIEAEWLYLIEKGSFPSEDVTAPLRSFLTGDYVCSLLEKAIKENKAGAYTYLQYGTTLYALDRQEEAADAWEKSFQISPNLGCPQYRYDKSVRDIWKVLRCKRQ